jgi:hypothetical protein
MTIQHSLITDPNIHEPKGITTASINQTYVADGAGSGDWKNVGTLVHGDMYIDAGVTAQTLPLASAYAKLNPGTEWTAGVANILVPSPSTGEITLFEAGTYQISFWAYFSTASLASGTGYNFKFALDGATAPRTLSVAKFTNGSDKLLVNATGLATVTDNQKLSIYVGGDGTSSNTAITIIEAGLTAIKLA